MYHYDKRAHRHKKLKRKFVWITYIVVLAAISFGLFHLRIEPKQEIKNSSSLSKSFKASKDEMQTFVKPELQFQASSLWKETPITKSNTSPNYVFKNVKSAQILEIYVDNPPQNRAVNRALVVRSENDGLIHDSVSDNCVTFTDSSRKNPQTGISPAKWQQVDFLCDMANTSRSVVGAVSSDGLNTIIVKTNSGKTYKMFFTYTDNNINPDFDVFYAILTSMKFQ